MIGRKEARTSHLRRNKRINVSTTNAQTQIRPSDHPRGLTCRSRAPPCELQGLSSYRTCTSALVSSGRLLNMDSPTLPFIRDQTETDRQCGRKTHTASS
eukprot:scaffold64864_cov64-Phaeocystis_antarctica.AAC.4